MIYQTMTKGGIYGAYFEAPSDEEATTLAEYHGYDVRDIIDSNDHGSTLGADFILVVA